MISDRECLDWLLRAHRSSPKWMGTRHGHRTGAVACVGLVAWGRRLALWTAVDQELLLPGRHSRCTGAGRRGAVPGFWRRTAERCHRLKEGRGTWHCPAVRAAVPELWKECGHLPGASFYYTP